MRATIAVLLLLLAAPAGAEPRTEPSDAGARKHWRRGLQLFDEESWDAASAQFWAGWAVEPFPPFLFAWAQARRLGGDCPSAVTLYRRFLAEKPPADQAQRARAGLKLCGK